MRRPVFRPTRILVIPLVSTIFFLLACSSGKSFQDPRIELENLRVSRTYQDAFDLEGTLKVFNPNDVGAKVSGYRYRLEVEGRRLMGGESRLPFEIPPLKAFRVQVPGTVYYQDLLAAGDRALSGQAFRYTLSGTLYLETVVGPYSVPFSQEGAMNLSEILQEKTRQLFQGLLDGNSP
jgi:LEA14-like dessication related protein